MLELPPSSGVADLIVDHSELRLMMRKDQDSGCQDSSSGSQAEAFEISWGCYTVEMQTAGDRTCFANVRILRIRSPPYATLRPVCSWCVLLIPL